MRKTLLISSILALAPCGGWAQDDSQNPIQEGVTYEIWSVQHSSGQVRKRGLSRKWRHAEWDEFYLHNEEAIGNFPREVKSVIAYYSQRISEHWIIKNDAEKVLADALGGFPSLSEAQATLLVDRDLPPFFAPAHIEAPAHLDITRRGDTLRVGTVYGIFGGRTIYDEYVLDGMGGVRYVVPPDIVIRLNDDCIIELNGKPLTDSDNMPFYPGDVFFDPDNIESVTVDKVMRVLRIEQKNKKEEPWFSLSDVEPAKIGIRDTTVTDIRERDVEVWVDDGTQFYSPLPTGAGYRPYVDGKTLIEHSMVARISPGLYAFSDKRYIIIRLKK